MLPQASTLASNIDSLFNFIFWFSLFSFLGIVGAIIYFVIKYHRDRRDPFKTPFIHGHTFMETSVAVFLLVVVMVIFVWGWVDYKKIITSPTDAIEVNVIGKQWLWEFEYTNGRKTTNELVIPKDRPVKLLLSSADVIHSFYVPNFRLKNDVIPGQYTSLWFNATKLGDHQVMCAEYCGTAHSNMLAQVKVVEQAAYDKWHSDWEGKKDKPGGPGALELSPVDHGKELFTAKGCVACHTVNGQNIIGPALNGIFGKEVQFTDGSKTKRDENYIRESLMSPAAKIVKGFQPLMPTFQGTLSDEEVNAIVAYIKSLKE